MHLEDYFKFGNHEVIKEKIKQQLLELNSNIRFSKYENHKHSHEMQQVSLKRQHYGNGVIMIFRRANDKEFCMKKMNKT